MSNSLFYFSLFSAGYIFGYSHMTEVLLIWGLFCLFIMYMELYTKFTQFKRIQNRSKKSSEVKE